VHAHFQRWQQGFAWDNQLFTRNLVQVAWSGTNNGAILQPQKTGIGFTSPRQIRVLIIPRHSPKPITTQKSACVYQQFSISALAINHSLTVPLY